MRICLVPLRGAGKSEKTARYAVRFFFVRKQPSTSAFMVHVYQLSHFSFAQCSAGDTITGL
jgi:hypothetical protein